MPTKHLPVMELPATDDERHLTAGELVIILDNSGNMTILKPLLPSQKQEKLAEFAKSYAKGRKAMVKV